ncbi:hypothetical protein SLOPH_880 [Spraguea lophii 42_110]|uniref:Uncharacterized protein n=1 Tax=Spraguea lophii (strain 42_110) TaxID=1358809 RepID=S7W8D4_SPRLO|nr:hypothetical protein SLOPH_880 [Spraguea lophii 42_110]
MLNREDFHTIYKEEIKTNTYVNLVAIKFIKISENNIFSYIVRISKLFSICFVFLLKVNSASISEEGKRARVQNITLELKKPNEVDNISNGIIENININAITNHSKLDGLILDILSFEYSGVEVFGKDVDRCIPLPNVESNTKGELEGKDISDNIIPEDEMYINTIIFKIKMKVNNHIYETYMLLIDMNKNYKYIDVTDNFTLTFKTFVHHVFLPPKIPNHNFYVRFDNSRGEYIDQNNIKCYSYKLSFKCESMSISNIHKNGYIYFYDKPREKRQRFIPVQITQEPLQNKFEMKHTMILPSMIIWVIMLLY